MYSAMNKTTAKTHSVDLRLVFLTMESMGRIMIIIVLATCALFSRWIVARQVETWSRQYKATKTEEIGAMNKAMDWLG